MANPKGLVNFNNALYYVGDSAGEALLFKVDGSASHSIGVVPGADFYEYVPVGTNLYLAARVGTPGSAISAGLFRLTTADTLTAVAFDTASGGNAVTDFYGIAALGSKLMIAAKATVPPTRATSCMRWTLSLPRPSSWLTSTPVPPARIRRP